MNAPLRKTAIVFGLAAVTLAVPAAAYETPVHSAITRAAFVQSMRDRDFLKDLGVLHFFDARGELRSEGFLGRTPMGWSMYGSIVEDSNVRSIFHFYDPLATGGQGLFGNSVSAPIWALEHPSNATYSLPGTRNSLFGALTNTDTIVRPKMWRDTFQGIGQFTHLLQDMAQPQHVRNDDHFSLTEQFFSLFPDYSRYEKHTLFLNAFGLLRFSGYPTVKLPTYRSYWNTGDDRGLAQSTNLNFVSEKTNLDTGRYGSPLATLLKEEVIPQVVDVFNRPITGATDVTVQYASYSYTDRYQGTPVTNDRLSAFSIFDFQRLQMTGRHAYSLYNTNHQRYAEILIPQAVGYSAGLMGRFLRGSMEISLPDEKVYGVVDHSSVNQTDALSGFVGFDTIKLKVRNATANAEALSGGSLRAVAKFHRNGCYKSDLTGEFGPSLTPPCGQFRTDTEEIVVSNTFTNVSLDATPKPFTFTFSQQIPINATDLYIQAVYRGALGTETDELAVATRDVFEPTYLAIFNSTDRILFNGTFLDTNDPALLPALDQNHDGVIDAVYDRTNLNVFFGFTDGFTATPLGTVTGLPPARYSRVAFLTDRRPLPVPIQAIGVGFNSPAVYTFGAEKNQIDIEAQSYNVSVLAPLRGVNSFNSLTLHRFFGSPSTGDLNTLPAIPNKAPFPLTSLAFGP